jgi:predicted lipoprotein with Yx(FWY)xxD motif
MMTRNGMAVLIVGLAFAGTVLAPDAPAKKMGGMTGDGFNGIWHVVKD